MLSSAPEPGTAMVSTTHRTAQCVPDRAGRRDERPVDRIVHRLRDEVGRDRFERYFNQARLEFRDGKLDVTVPTGFAAELLDRRFGHSIRQAIAHTTNGHGAPAQLNFHVDSSAFDAASRIETHVRQEAQSDPPPIPFQPTQHPTQHPTQIRQPAPRPALFRVQNGRDGPAVVLPKGPSTRKLKRIVIGRPHTRRSLLT